MQHARYAARIAALVFFAGLFSVTNGWAQADPSPRRGAGARVGAWKVKPPGTELSTYSHGPQLEVYVQRGLDDRLALESTIGVWRRTARTTPTVTANTVTTNTYVLPLITALKIFPVTHADQALEPFILAGAGFALGIDDVSENAIGGGGTSIGTGFGTRVGAGLEYHLNDVFGLMISGRYQLIRYGEDLGGAATYKGFGFEGGLTYRFGL
jgi:outer membrane protein W